MKSRGQMNEAKFDEDFNDSHFVTVLSINKKDGKNSDKQPPVDLNEMMRKPQNAISRSSNNLKLSSTTTQEPGSKNTFQDRKVLISSGLDPGSGHSNTLPSRSKSLNTFGFVTVLEIGNETDAKSRAKKASCKELRSTTSFTKKGQNPQDPSHQR